MRSLNSIAASRVVAPAATAWFTHPHVTESLPTTYRALAWYFRRIGNVETGSARGGSYLHRRLNDFARLFRLRTEASVDTPIGKLHVDFRDPATLGVLNETFLTLVHIVQSILRPGDTFIDIGANHGTYTIAAAYRVGSTGRVHAFEPQPRMASFIRSAITANGLQNVELREVALAEADGTASFFVADTRTGGLYEQFSGIGRGDARVLTVSTLNLDSLTDQLAIGASGRFVVKLDAEGSERGIVRGGKKFFSAHRPPILLEINPRSATAAGYTARDLLDELAAIGYTEGIELDAFTSSELAGIPLSELNATVERDVVIR